MNKYGEDITPREKVKSKFFLLNISFLQVFKALLIKQQHYKNITLNDII